LAFRAASLGDENLPIEIKTEAWHEVHVLKELNRQYISNQPALTTVQQGQRRLLDDLFHTLLEWTEEDYRDPSLPMSLLDLLETAGSWTSDATDSDLQDEDAIKVRHITDVIASLRQELRLCIRS
jgi:dGTP triphosphohydrolase